MTDILGPGSNATNVVTARPTDSRVMGATDTWFKDCTSPSSNDGTRVPAASLNSLLANLRSIVRSSGIADDPVADDLIRKAILTEIRTQSACFGSAGGTANALTATLVPAPLTLTAGMFVRLLITATNTGAATLNLNGLGVKSIVTPKGTALAAGDLFVGSIVNLVYDGTVFQILDVTSASVLNAFINAGRPAASAPYFLANGVAGGATYANGVASVSTDFTVSQSVFLDAGTTFSGGILTIGPKDAGIWQFSANLGLNAAVLGWTSKVSLLANAITFAYTEVPIYGTASSGNMSISGSVKLASGDTVKTTLIQNTGASQASSASNRFSGSRVGV